MSTISIDKKVRQPWRYQLWAWLGRTIFNLRDTMEYWQDYCDLEAGKHWIEN